MDESDDPKLDRLLGQSISNELSANRTAMSFQRTLMSTDRTLMSVIRTSFSLITFGFSIYEIFRSLADGPLKGALPEEAPRRFGVFLIVLGIILLAIGLYNHWEDAKSLQQRRERLIELGVLTHTGPIRISKIAAAAFLLLLVGIWVFLRVGLHIDPF